MTSKPPYPYFGFDLIPSFRPTHVTVGGEFDETRFPEEVRKVLGGWGEYVPGSMREYAFCRTPKGEVRFRTLIGRVRPARPK